MPGEEAGRRASSSESKAQESGREKTGRAGRAGSAGAPAARGQLGGLATPALQPRRGRRAAGGREGEWNGEASGVEGWRAAAQHCCSALAARVQG